MVWGTDSQDPKTERTNLPVSKDPKHTLRISWGGQSDSDNALSAVHVVASPPKWIEERMTRKEEKEYLLALVCVSVEDRAPCLASDRFA